MSEDLSKRELDIIQAVANEGAYKVVAANRDISKRTVEIHMSRVLKKLGVSTAPMAVAEAIRRGIIE